MKRRDMSLRPFVHLFVALSVVSVTGNKLQCFKFKKINLRNLKEVG